LSAKQNPSQLWWLCLRKYIHTDVDASKKLSLTIVCLRKCNHGDDYALKYFHTDDESKRQLLSHCLENLFHTHISAKRQYESPCFKNSNHNCVLKKIESRWWLCLRKYIHSDYDDSKWQS